MANDETGRFMRAVAALSAAPEDVSELGRRLKPVSRVNEPLLAGMIHEIDETVLRRNLTFRNASHEFVTLEVMERRILKVAMCSDEVCDQNWQGKHVASADAASIIEIMRGLADKKQDIYVSSNLCDTAASAPFEGVSARDLNAVMDTVLNHENMPSELDVFLESSKEYALAFASISPSGALSVWGDGQYAAVLENACEQNAETDKSTDGIKIWGSFDSLGPHVFTALFQGYQVLGCFSADHVGKCLSLWHASVSNPR
ncbi:MAG: hypothetical protein AB8B47_08940 [Roseobacter sp.]